MHVKTILDEVIAVRRALHRHPEIAFLEHQTANAISAFLTRHGIPHKTGVAKTGVVAQVTGKHPGKTILFRADMDALPIKEETGLPFQSEIDGMMHACGHDIHVATLLGAAYVINQMKDQLCGAVRFVFQPAEEATGGAADMIAQGVLDGVSCALAAHVCPETETGAVSTKAGEFYASPDHFNVTIHGKGAHGAEPQAAIDPIAISAAIISNLQNIVSRQLDPLSPAVLSICYINAGNSENIIPDTAKFGGTFRSFDNDTRHRVRDLIEAYIKNTCAAFGATYDFRYVFLYPPIINDAALTNQFVASAKTVLGSERVRLLDKPCMLGEDFSYFANAVPACYFKLGCRQDPAYSSNALHTATFNPNEDCIQYGIQLFAEFALNKEASPNVNAQ